MRLPLLLLAILALPAFAQSDEEWIESPEAVFATRDERREWAGLTSRAEKDAFKNRYWLRRDPTIGTEKNEFRETVLGRIKVADERWPTGKTAGSRTARGRVFILLGTPARVAQRQQPRNPAPPPPGSNPTGPVGTFEGNETSETWFYDRERTPRILEILSNRPSLDLTIIVEPTRRRDRLQNPGLLNQFQEILAEKTIVNPALTSGTKTLPPPPPAFAPIDRVPEAVKAALENPSRGESAFGNLLVWPETGTGNVVVWFAVPAERAGKLGDTTITAALRSGDSVRYYAAEAKPSQHFFTSRPQAVFAAQLSLPPGNHSASFALTDKGEVVAAAKSPIQVPDLTQDFSVSSIVLTGGANQATGDETSPFRFGSALLAPRADSTYLRSESLWYFFEVANPSSAEQVKIKTQLRRPGAPITGTPQSPAQLQQVAPGRYVAGFEIPLSTLEPGDYSLYATVTDPTRGEVVKRADFRILPD